MSNKWLSLLPEVLGLSAIAWFFIGLWHKRDKPIQCDDIPDYIDRLPRFDNDYWYAISDGLLDIVVSIREYPEWMKDQRNDLEGIIKYAKQITDFYNE